MERFRSLIFYIFLIIWTVMVFAVGIVSYVLRCEKAVVKGAQIWGAVTVKVLSVICSVKVNVKGVENIPKGACIIASKHQSMWETIFLLGYLDDAKFVIKKQLGLIPLYGQYTKMIGMILVDRSAGVSALKGMVKKSVEVLKGGGRVVIFPEGTRVSVGEKVRLKGGVAAIHREIPGVPILPVYLDSGAVWPSKSLIVKSGEINVVFKKVLIGKFESANLLNKIHNSINTSSIE